jgi:crotonobetainyl-CoA:carnitine CoA-transferase CaiB-like acyl-CoA transferase
MPWLVPGSVPTEARGPKLGEHTAEICRDLLGFDDAKISELVEQGVLEEAVS